MSLLVSGEIERVSNTKMQKVNGEMKKPQWSQERKTTKSFLFAFNLILFPLDIGERLRFPSQKMKK